ncbi:MAG: hypothetical protein ACYCVH_06735 [Ignavibacteriaceae bacterium]
MKKRCKEEKQDLKTEINSFYFFVLILFFSTKIFPQVPINGFCKYNSFKVPTEYNSLIALNFNNDHYTDLVLFNPNKKKIISLTGEGNGNFGKPVISRIPLEITKIQNINEINSPIKRYAFTSRQNRKVGIYSFTNSGRAILSREIKFNSYPENISAVDINGNGKDELLISGPAFNGLSILYLTPKGILNKKIITDKSFSDAVFANLSNDGLSDIAAFNAMNNSLIFLYNNGNNNFKEVRSFKMNEKIHLLQPVDLNLDHYQDLMFAKGKSIVIMCGDYTSSYNRIETIKTDYYPDKIITGDFNQDGKIDIAYINYEKSILSILFAKGDNEFYPEIIYMHKNGLKNLIPYYSKFINGIEAISDEGNIYSITNLTSFTENVNITVSPKPRALTFFDHSNNGIIDLCFIDSLEHSLDLLIRNNSGKPAWYYSYPLFEDHDQIVVDNVDPKVKTFYCFDRGKKLIEILRVDFQKNTVERRSLYSLGPIADLKIKRNNGDVASIYAAFIDNGNLGLSIMEYHNYRYTYTNYQNLAYNVKSANISLNKGISLIYLQTNGNNILLDKTIFNGENISTQTKISLPALNLSSTVLLTSDFLNKDEDETLSFINADEKPLIIFSTDKFTKVIMDKNYDEHFEANNVNDFYFGEIRNSGLKKLFSYNSINKNIDKVEFIRGGKEVVISKIAEADNLQSYFIKNMSFRKIHLVYTDKENNCITIKQLQ